MKYLVLILALITNLAYANNQSSIEMDKVNLEVNQQYLSRWEELLKVHMGDHGALPPGNVSHRPRRIGQLSLG